MTPVTISKIPFKKQPLPTPAEPVTPPGGIITMDPAPSAKSILYLYRVDDLAGTLARMEIHLDDKKLVDLRIGAYMYTEIEAGPHFLEKNRSSRDRPELTARVLYVRGEFEVPAGKHCYVEIKGIDPIQVLCGGKPPPVLLNSKLDFGKENTTMFERFMEKIQSFSSGL